MKVEARRGALRHGPQPYGVQQARNLYNARKRDKAIPSAQVLLGLLSSVRRMTNKGWVRPVPAAAVIPAPQVASALIWPKAFVAGRINLL